MNRRGGHGQWSMKTCRPERPWPTCSDPAEITAEAARWLPSGVRLAELVERVEPRGRTLWVWWRTGRPADVDAVAALEMAATEVCLYSTVYHVEAWDDEVIRPRRRSHRLLEAGVL